MNKVLYAQSTQQVLPYPRLDDGTVEGLDPDFLVLTKVETTPPEITDSQSLSSTYVVDVENLEYRQQWTVEDNPPTPDWDAFNAYMLSDAMFKSYRDTVRPLDGDLTSALFTAYNRVASDGVSAFSLVWGQWCSVSGITAEDKEVIAGVAEGFNLPAEFVGVVRGN